MKFQAKTPEVIALKLRRKLKENQKLYTDALQARKEQEDYSEWKKRVDTAIAKINEKIRLGKYL